MARGLAGRCLVAAMTVAGGAYAADGASTVVVLAPMAPDDAAVEATTRVEGELQAAGFHVAVVRAGSDADTEVETAGGELHPIAAFAIRVGRDERGTFAEIHICDRLHQRTVVERSRLPPSEHPRESAVLAVRAVELVRASLAELGLRPADTPPPAPPAPSAAPAQALPEVLPASATERRSVGVGGPFRAGVGLGAGLGVVVAPGAIGPFWLPRLVASLGTGQAWAIRIELQGLGPAVQVGAVAGTAAVDLRIGTVGVAKTWWPDGRFVPFVSAGAGVQEVHVAGNANAPYRGLVSDTWSPLTEAGVGLAVPIVAGVSFVVESLASVAWPPAAIAIAGADEGHVGGPSWLADAWLSGVLP